MPARRRRAVSQLARALIRFEPIERRILLSGSISGTVFSDYNGNGVHDAGEPGLAGWTVFLDANNNGIPDAGEQTRTTNASGFYEFTNLVPATYTVRQLLQPGYTQTLPGSGGVILGGAGSGANGGTGGAAGAEAGGSGRRFSTTEVVVAFEGKRGKPVLSSKVKADASLRRLVDYDRSRDLFTTNNVSLVEVKVPRGVDPMLVVQRFSQLNGVRWAQPNYIYDGFDPREFSPNDPQFSAQLHHTVMQTSGAWNVTLGSPDILIGVTDDGVLLNHPDLAQNIWTNPGEIPGNGIDDDGNGFIDDVNGWSFWDNNNNPNPANAQNDHGTHVAGIAAARTNNAIGVAGTAGGSTIVPIRFYSTTSGSWTSTIVANAYHYAAIVGCKIVVTSYNVDFFSNDSIFAAGLQFMYDAGVLHFNSAGNSSQVNPPRQRWDQSLFVANTLNNDIRSSTSNYGWGIDISAPGSEIFSTGIGSNLNDPNYEHKSGTSMATPNAAGIAALIWSANPTWTREQVAAQLLGTADNIDAANPSIAGLLGAGRVNAYRALTETIAPPRIKSLAGLPGDGGFITGKPASFTLDVASVFDPATMVLSNFELRGAGVDGKFGTSDDVLIPMTLSFGSSFGSSYMIGTNRLNFTIPGSMTPGLYRFAAASGLQDPFGQPIDGNGDGAGGDAFTRTFTLMTASPAYTVHLGDGQHVAMAHFGNHDIAGPRVQSAALHYATSPHKIVVRFNEPVEQSQVQQALSLVNLSTSQPMETSGFGFEYDADTNTCTWDTKGILADGRYRATIAASAVADLSGNALDGNADGVAGDDHSFDFFFLLGDANHDGVVNLADFNILAANFGQSGRDFTQGDFTYDGTVNLADFNILAARFGMNLPAASSAIAQASATEMQSAAASANPTRAPAAQPSSSNTNLSASARASSRSAPAPASTPTPFSQRAIGTPPVIPADDPLELLA